MFLQTVRPTQLIVPAAGPPNKVNKFDGEWCLDTLAKWSGVSCLGRGTKDDGQTDSTGDDGPAGSANSTIGHEQYRDDLNTYVMFKSKEAHARWVPLKVIEWNAGYTSTVTGGDIGSEVQTFNSSFPQASRTLTGSETALHPEWSHLASLEIVTQ